VAGEQDSVMVVKQVKIKSVQCTSHGADITSMNDDAGGKQYYCAVQGAIAHLANKLATNTAVQKNGECGHPLLTSTRKMMTGRARQRHWSCAAVSTIWCHYSKIRWGTWIPSSTNVDAEKGFIKHKMGLHVYCVVKGISVQRTRIPPRAQVWCRMCQRSQWAMCI